MSSLANNLKSQLIAKTGKIRSAGAAVTALKAAASHIPINDLQPANMITDRKLSDIKLPPRRLRKAGPERVRVMIDTIKRFGFRGAIFVRNGVIVDGVARYLAMKELGEPTIPTIDIENMTEEECRLFAITYNRTAETGEWDLPELRLELVELQLEVPDLPVTNFSPQELDIIMLDPDPEEGELLDELPDEPDEAEQVVGGPVSVLGDLWQLGAHRLICGDALNAETYDTLLGDEQVACVFTDPPYNCVIQGNVSGLGAKVHDEFVQASGEMTDAEFSDFLTGFLIQCRDRCIKGAVIYAFMDWRNYPRLVTSAQAASLKYINGVVWDKGSGGMGSLYRSAHEWIGVFCIGTKPATNNVELGKHGRDRANIWRHPGANKPGSSAAEMLGDHPTPKPVQLVSNALLDVTKQGDLVLEPFSGSGTTIIACAEVGRVARAIELDPKYVDVALRRWFARSGQEAVLVETGETFTQVAARRAAAASQQ